MDDQEKNKPVEPKTEQGKDFGRVIDALHDKNKLPSLRTYQGDVSDFMKEKNESTASIVVKEREAKREKGELKPPKPQKTSGNKSVSLTMILVSIVLLAGGAWVVTYVIDILFTKPPAPITAETKIIPYNQTLTLANVTKDTLGKEMANLPLQSGTSIIKISGRDGKLISDVSNFFEFLSVSPPNALVRILEDDFVVGALLQGESQHHFLVVKVSDFGVAFSAMLEWEEEMNKDLAFLNYAGEEDVSTDIHTSINTSSATSTDETATSTLQFTPPLIQHFWQWKDLIIKNKDTRGLVDQYGETRLAYTFLDKNTILIINNAYAVGDIASAYASRSFAR